MHFMPCSRVHEFLVPNSSHPFRSPHPHVRSSSFPESRQPSFIIRMRTNRRISYHHRSCHSYRKGFQRDSLRNIPSHTIFQQSQICWNQIDICLELHFGYGPIRHDGHVRSRLLVRRKVGQRKHGQRRRRHGCLLGLFDRD